LLDYLPKPAKSISITIIITLISVILSTVFDVSIFKNPDIEVSVLEWKDYRESSSTIKTIVQNIGNVQGNNIVIVYDSPFRYDLQSFNSTESIPRIIDSSDGRLRINIERLSPDSYVILDTKGLFQENSSKKIWVSTDTKTELLILNMTENNLGVTTINFSEKINNPMIIESIAGAGLFLLYRYFSYLKYEYFRRKYLGVYNFKLRKNTIAYYLVGLVIIYIIAVIGVGVDKSQSHFFLNYTPYVDFDLNSRLSENNFIFTNTNKPGVLYEASLGNLLLFLGIFVLVLHSKIKSDLPPTIWLRPLPYSKIQVDKVSGSYVTTKVVSPDTRTKIMKDNVDVYVVKEGDKILAIISQVESSRYEVFKTRFRTLLRRKQLYPKWDEEKSIRDNFVTAYIDETLDILKHKMEEEGKQFAVILDRQNNFKGVLDYKFIFYDRC